MKFYVATLLSLTLLPFGCAENKSAPNSDVSIGGKYGVNVGGDSAVTVGGPNGVVVSGERPLTVGGDDGLTIGSQGVGGDDGDD